MDRSSKLLLALIAFGLWANVATQFIHPATAQSDELVNIASDLMRISQGICINRRIC